MIDFTSIGRDDLIDQYKLMASNLTHTQARCTELIEEARELRRRLPGKSLDDYQLEASRTSSHELPYTDYSDGDPPMPERLLMSAMGVAGEGGEVCDLAKKVMFHDAVYQPDRFAKELGDVLWYVAEGASAMGMKLSDVAAMNIEKLMKRYPPGSTLHDRRQEKQRQIEEANRENSKLASHLADVETVNNPRNRTVTEVLEAKQRIAIATLESDPRYLAIRDRIKQAWLDGTPLEGVTEDLSDHEKILFRELHTLLFFNPKESTP